MSKLTQKCNFDFEIKISNFSTPMNECEYRFDEVNFNFKSLIFNKYSFIENGSKFENLKIL